MKKKTFWKKMIGIMGAGLLGAAVLGYFQILHTIPNEVNIAKGEADELSKIFPEPLVQWEDSIPTSGNGQFTISCSIFGKIPLKQVKVKVIEPEEVYVCGNTVGLYMETQGIMVIDSGEVTGTDGVSYDPAEHTVQSGDYIVACNDRPIGTKKELVRNVNESKGESVKLSVIRKGQEVDLALDPIQAEDGRYKLGIWVRDDTQGIGTMTYVDEEGGYGALGHGISDIDTGELLHIREGDLYQTEILGIQKGSKGTPGELAGLIRYEKGNILGSIACNYENGVYGILDDAARQHLNLKKMEIGYKQEMETGEASILCCVNGQVEEYEIEITKIDYNHQNTNKSFVIKVTDERLLEATGGIVQGMSGSPVLQHGKLVGAVTHVFVQDAAGGYGIFIENMLEASR